jgi:hypothetical protein
MTQEKHTCNPQHLRLYQRPNQRYAICPRKHLLTPRDTSALPHPFVAAFEKKKRTLLYVVLEAHANFALRMGRDGQPSLPVDIPLVQVHVLFRTRVDDLNVDTLVGAGSDVRGDYHKRVYVGSIPNAFCWWVALCRENEFDGTCGV